MGQTIKKPLIITIIHYWNYKTPFMGHTLRPTVAFHEISHLLGARINAHGAASPSWAVSWSGFWRNMMENDGSRTKHPQRMVILNTENWMFEVICFMELDDARDVFFLILYRWTEMELFIQRMGPWNGEWFHRKIGCFQQDWEGIIPKWPLVRVRIGLAHLPTHQSQTISTPPTISSSTKP